jgi:hypothetical protein
MTDRDGNITQKPITLIVYESPHLIVRSVLPVVSRQGFFTRSVRIGGNNIPSSISFRQSVELCLF